MNQIKICTKCKIEKTLDKFGKRSNTKDGFRCSCKECEKLWRSSYEIKNQVVLIEGVKKCSKCNVVQDISEFGKCKDSSDGLRYSCKKCSGLYYKYNIIRFLIYSKQYNKNNKEFRLEYKKIYRNKNSEKIKEYNKKYNIENKLSIQEYSKKYNTLNRELLNNKERDKISNCSLYKLKRNIKSLIYNSFKNNDYLKTTTLSLISCNIKELKTHITSQFSNWMSWELHGKYDGNFNFGYDIDHIIPISYAKTEKEVYLLNHWSNFQPLCSKVNRDIKKAKVYPCTNLELGITFWEDYYEYV